MRHTILTRTAATLLVVFAMAFPALAQTIPNGTYVCQNNTGAVWIGDLIVKGSTYSVPTLEKQTGTFTYDATTHIMKFNKGWFDTRNGGDEQIGVFYNKGDEFINSDPSAKAANTMILIYKLKDWNDKKVWWNSQQCDLK